MSLIFDRKKLYQSGNVDAEISQFRSSQNKTKQIRESRFSTPFSKWRKSKENSVIYKFDFDCRAPTQLQVEIHSFRTPHRSKPSPYSLPTASESLYSSSYVAVVSSQFTSLFSTPKPKVIFQKNSRIKSNSTPKLQSKLAPQTGPWLGTVFARITSTMSSVILTVEIVAETTSKKSNAVSVLVMKLQEFTLIHSRHVSFSLTQF